MCRRISVITININNSKIKNDFFLNQINVFIVASKKYEEIDYVSTTTNIHKLVKERIKYALTLNVSLLLGLADLVMEKLALQYKKETNAIERRQYVYTIIVWGNKDCPLS